MSGEKKSKTKASTNPQLITEATIQMKKKLYQSTTWCLFTSEQQTETYQDIDWEKHTVKEQIWSEQKKKVTEFPWRGKSYGLKLMVAIELNIQCLCVMFLLNIKFWKQQRLTTWKSLSKFIETSDESFSIKHSFKKLTQGNVDQWQKRREKNICEH